MSAHIWIKCSIVRFAVCFLAHVNNERHLLKINVVQYVIFDDLIESDCGKTISMCCVDFSVKNFSPLFTDSQSTLWQLINGTRSYKRNLHRNIEIIHCVTANQMYVIQVLFLTKTNQLQDYGDIIFFFMKLLKTLFLPKGKKVKGILNRERNGKYNFFYIYLFVHCPWQIIPMVACRWYGWLSV